jgi:hypothetical protein
MYEFGNRFQITDFKNALEVALIDSLIDEAMPMYEAIIYAFEHLLSCSLVLQAMIDVYCAGWVENSDTEENRDLELWSELPHSFLLGVALRYMRI